jgi:hypothetical protein
MSEERPPAGPVEGHAAGARGADARRRAEFLLTMGAIYDGLIARAGADGETFDRIEAQAVELGRETCRELLPHRLDAEERRRLAAAGPDCPTCGRPARTTAEARERRLETSAGVVAYRRLHGYCDRCRSSFSPSGPSAGHPGAGRVGAAGPQDL